MTLQGIPHDVQKLGYDPNRFPGTIFIREGVLEEDELWMYELSQQIPQGNKYRIDKIGGLPRGTVCVADQLDPALFPVAMQLEFNSDPMKYDFGLTFPYLLRQLLGPNEAHPDRDMWIPFDMEERKKKFPEAFEELEPFFDYIRRNPTV